ncbi:MAG: urea ABC transporter substrate-binding protein [Candidatus Rokubacteria bacterium]|nr:urea ABC transporter substrate-binding protein [Candidatus Rokubacteria bacterium]
MPRRRVWPACILWLACAASAAGQARDFSVQEMRSERRVALVIGNARYADKPLTNPANDAQDIARALRDSGFEVLVKTDAGREDMLAALRQFRQRLASGGVGLFYYAGHAVQIQGKNFLMPVDVSVAKISGADAVEDHAVSVDTVLARMSEASTRVRIVILDACRENPFARTRSFRSGLAGIGTAPRGTFIAYATSPDDVAEDGPGRNGLYTAELLRAMSETGLKIEDVFKRVTNAVEQVSNGRQIPWTTSSLRNDFYFRLPSTASTSPAPPPPPQRPEAVRKPADDVDRRPPPLAGASIRVGVLHSLSGTMAISEGPLKEVVLMALDEINRDGGILGRPVEAVVEDPASNWDLFAEKAKKLLLQDRVAAIFGGWTSVSRKAMLPVLERSNGLLFYPVAYEGHECSRNVIYSGATLNQQATPAIDYLMSPDGGSKRRFYLLGTDYVYPRTANRILRAYLTRVKGVSDSGIAEEYTPFNHQDYRTIVGKIKSFGAAGDAAVINTINGASNVPFFKELANQGVTADRTPTMSFGFAEVELQTLDVKPFVGHLASWNYFMSLKTPENLRWVTAWKALARRAGISDSLAVTDDAMMHAYLHVHLWAKAVQKAGSPDVERVLTALEGLDIRSPTGKYKVDEQNHHTWKPVYVGKIRDDGQFDVIWRTRDWVRPDPWSQVAYPGRGCDWSEGGKGTFDTVAGRRSWLSDNR